MAFIPGKYGRVTVSGTPITGSFRWGMQQRRNALDTTNFESAVSGDGYNVFEEQVMGTLGTTISVEGYTNTAQLNILAPAGQAVFTFLYSKSPALGYAGVTCDILEFSPGTTMSDVTKYTAQVKANGGYTYTAS